MDRILIGRGQQFLELQMSLWNKHLTQIPQQSQSKLLFMTDTHHRVRSFVVKKLAEMQEPITPEFIANRLNMQLARVTAILEEMENNLFFLVRNEKGAVTWAFPVTVETTPHKLIFSTSLQLYGASAEHSFAAAYVGGQLNNDYLSVDIDTSCKHCRQPMRITVDSNMRVSVNEKGAQPLVFMPDVDWTNFTEKNILQAYCKKSVFFWSEDHAREFRANSDQSNGIYLNLEQCARMTPITQGALFAFER